MSIIYRSLYFIISFLILFLILMFTYKIGWKRGIKKALYRITYRCICVILSFLLAPYLTDYILNFNLYPHGHSIEYNGMNFYRIIDFIEEVIVHSEILNDIYYLFPNLKSLLIDFPHIIFIPFAYLLSFIIFSIILLPLYFYLGYRRNRRILYEVSYKRSSRVWAGILTSVQTIFLISIVLTPINGLVRIYCQSKVGQLEYDENLCAQSEYLVKYEAACAVIEGYSNTMFYIVGNNPVNGYIYDSLTRVEYGRKQTTFTNEFVSIAKAGIILNKTGLLTAINTEFNDFSDISTLNLKGLTTSDIDTIVLAFEQSLYTREVLNDVYEFAREYLNYLLKESLSIDVMMELTYEELVNELRVILTAINLILNNDSYMDNIWKVYGYIKKFDMSSQSDEDELALFFDVAYNVDLVALREIYELLCQSKIYRLVVPKLLDYLLSTIDVHVNMDADPEEMDITIRLAFGIIEIFQSKQHRYKYNLFNVISNLTDEEISYLARVIKYVNNTKTMNTLFYDLANYGLSKAQLKMDIPTELLFEVENWTQELKLARLVITIVYKSEKYGYIDYDLALHGLKTYSNTVIFKYAWKMGINMLPDVFKMWLAGKDYKYLVGEYVCGNC